MKNKYSNQNNMAMKHIIKHLIQKPYDAFDDLGYSNSNGMTALNCISKTRYIYTYSKRLLLDIKIRKTNQIRNALKNK